MKRINAENHPAAKLVEKMGKKAFVEMAMNRNSNEKTGYEKDRGIRGRIKWRVCEHGIVKIDNFEYTGLNCAVCDGEARATKPKDFKPYFNQGLGHFVTSRSEEKRIAKSMGLVEAG